MTFSLERFKRIPIIGILRGLPEDAFKPILATYLAAGFSTIEVTMNTNGAAQMISEAAEQYGDQLNIGAGTVRNMQELELALSSGAQFVVTPILNSEIIKTCVRLNIPIFPGAYTPTEIYRAWELGSTAVKVFPATIGGIQHIKAVKAPLEMIPLVPTGGVSLQNLPDYFDLGIFGVGMGGQLFPTSILQRKDWKALAIQLEQIKMAYDGWKEAKG